MNTLKSISLATFTCAILGASSFSSHAMDKYVETALIDVCKSTLTNNVLQFHKTTKNYHLKDTTVAMRVMCNGDDIITFAEKHGAFKTASRLEKSMSGKVNIIDVAAVDKLQVNFTF